MWVLNLNLGSYEFCKWAIPSDDFAWIAYTKILITPAV